jgi:hypothetical protein
MEPVRHEALRDEASAECVEGEQGREPGHDATRALAEAQPQPDPVGRDGLPGGLDRRTDPREDRGHRQPKHGVGDEDRAIRVGVAEVRGEQRLRREPCRQSPDGRCYVACQVVPGKNRDPALVRRRLAQRRLFDREEGPNFVPGRADDANRGGEDEKWHPARQGKRNAGDHHQH